MEILKRRYLSITFSYFFLLCLLSRSLVGADATCVDLSQEYYPYCKSMKYNRTMYPNLLNHRGLDDSSQEMKIFNPLIKVQCAPELEVFLCSLFAPSCISVGPIPPCRELCEKARDGCILLMNTFGVLWPAKLECNRWPKKRQDVLCVDVDATDNKSGDKTGTLDPDIFINNNNKWPSLKKCHNGTSFDKAACPSHQQKDGKHYSYMGKTKCASLCQPLYFTNKETEFAHNWVMFWSIACMLSTAFTLLTFIVDMPRFRYPERPIIFLSGCYFIISIAFLTGPVSGKGVACHKTDSGVELLNQGTENAACTIVFMLIYFFLMSASIWWVVLTLTWFLAAGLKWGHEAIESSSQYFHAAAWAIPAAKTIAILALNRVDGDILSGICFVGGKNINALRGFVLVPLFIYLVVGTLFLLGGFIALIQIRKVLKEDSSLRIEKLTRLMVRIGIFSILYSLPAIIVIACLFYEQSYRNVWDDSYKQEWLRLVQDSDKCTVTQTDFLGKIRPDFAVYMIKYLMLLMVGITSGFWIWSGKTIQSWKRFYYNKILHQRVPPRQYESKEGSAFTARTLLP